MVKVNGLTLTFDFSLSNPRFQVLNFLLGLFISFTLIKSYFHFFKTRFKPKFDQVNSAIKVNPALCGSTRYLRITWFYILSLWVQFYKCCVLTAHKNASSGTTCLLLGVKATDRVSSSRCNRSLPCSLLWQRQRWSPRVFPRWNPSCRPSFKTLMASWIASPIVNWYAHYF